MKSASIELYINNVEKSKNLIVYGFWFGSTIFDTWIKMLIIRNAFLNLPAMILKHLNLDVYALNYFNRLILFTAHE